MRLYLFEVGIYETRSKKLRSEKKSSPGNVASPSASPGIHVECLRAAAGKSSSRCREYLANSRRAWSSVRDPSASACAPRRCNGFRAAREEETRNNFASRGWKWYTCSACHTSHQQRPLVAKQTAEKPCVCGRVPKPLALST